MLTCTGRCISLTFAVCSACPQPLSRSGMSFSITERVTLVNNAFFQTFRQSGLFGQFIIIFLLGLSVYAWYIILDKVRYLRAAERSSLAFLRKFRSEGKHIFSLRFPPELADVCPFYRIYREGVRELGQIRELSGSGPPPPLRQALEDVVDRAIAEETMTMEKTMIVLAVTATIGPLMGLLGTVWGIMNAFQGMGVAGNASIGTVAPGISEALVTTVVGLLVAIPALAFYNVIMNKVRRLTMEMNSFASEFISLAERSVAGGEEEY